MCREREPRVSRSATEGSCGCGCGPSLRRFYSADEVRERLESYREELKKELAGVEERLIELKQE